MRTTIFITALLTAVVATLVGCSNSSGPSASDYLDPTSPENVLLNLERAYGERDLDEYLDCMSEDFKFHFTEEDQQGWPQLPPWFYKSDEQQVHENMFGDEWNVESIHLTLTVASVETIPGGDLRTDDDVVIHAEADLMVNLGDLSYLATNSQDFYFRTVAGSEEREGRVLWEMFDWHDLDRRDNGGRVEEAGWGGIKYCFLESLSQTARRTSPAEVIDQLQAAYVAMDTLNYLDCLSGDFIFFPSEVDLQDPNNTMPDEWYKPDERSMHENMFADDVYVASIQLILTNTYIYWDEHDPGDPLDDIYSHTEDVALWVYLLGQQTFFADGPQQYLLRVDPDEEGPYGGIMWEIYEWDDLDSERGGEGADGRENITWGSIKALFW